MEIGQSARREGAEMCSPQVLVADESAIAGRHNLRPQQQPSKSDSATTRLKHCQPRHASATPHKSSGTKRTQGQLARNYTKSAKRSRKPYTKADDSRSK